MISLRFKYKIMLGMFAAALASGCAEQPVRPVATKDPPSPRSERHWYEDLDVAADSSGTPGAAVQKTQGSVVHVNANNGQILPQPPTAPPTQQGITQRTEGMVVHVDPNNGQILPQPPTAVPTHGGETQWFHSATAPAEQPQEVLSPTPGGGVMVNLHRQFHQPLIATIDETGKVHLRHGRVNQPSAATK